MIYPLNRSGDVDRRIAVELAVVGALILAVLMVFLGCLVYPELFWDRFVWKYYWGPIVADAGGDAGGLTSSYNWLDTLTYGAILALSAYFIHRLFVHRDTRVRTGFFLALSPIILIGPAARVLEDMELFNEPLQYVFISPVIYIFLGLATLVTILAGERIERTVKNGNIAAGLFLFTPSLIISLVIEAFPCWFNSPIPIIPILSLGSIFPLVHGSLLKKRRWEVLVGLFWLQILLAVVYMYVIWSTHGDWYDLFTSMSGGNEPETHYESGLGIIGLVILSTSLVATGIWLAGLRRENVKKLLTGVNILIIGGHMLDASATFIGIDFHGYSEKHVVPSTLMGWLEGTGFPYPGMVMYPLKLLFLIPALYFMDVAMEKDTRGNPHLMALVKLTILILGSAPGTRDIIRLMLGV